MRGLQILADEIDVIKQRVDTGQVSLVASAASEADGPVAAWSSEPRPQDDQSTKTAHTLTEQVGLGSPISLE
jgi:hypothetical protein